MNVADGERMAGELASLGYERLPETAAPDEADILFLGKDFLASPNTSLSDITHTFKSGYSNPFINFFLSLYETINRSR